MADTLDRLMAHHGPQAKAVVWEHNTHVGDARATDMADVGEVNVGQLVRERHMGRGVVLVGFGSHSGTVLAADAWGDVPRIMGVPPARTGSLEDLLHRAVRGERALFVFPHVQLQGPPSAGRAEWFHEEHGHRAIGAVYRPRYDRVGNYVPTVLAQRYDAFCYLDRTVRSPRCAPWPGNPGRGRPGPRACDPRRGRPTRRDVPRERRFPSRRTGTRSRNRVCRPLRSDIAGVAPGARRQKPGRTSSRRAP
ncbi:erythromycin esterase family protein [Streptomyces sp. NPDC004629]|uniref:erythromycin esterase family protein n=1 Tax=Streptomyces sp. NPDC004629 TaxID=3364705 RepID=UPI0036A8D4CA